jgi:hypothetical protein
MPNLDAGQQTWRRETNHNRMIELQGKPMDPAATLGSVRIAYFGSSAFRITSPEGISVMVDPWRNHPSGKWDWYFADMPEVAVDIGVSTHAHFDHDALERLRCARPAGPPDWSVWLRRRSDQRCRGQARDRFQRCCI